MGRGVRDNRLQTREGRRKLPAGRETYWARIDKTVSIGYRKNSGSGVWTWRLRRGGEYIVKNRVLGKADDSRDADGVEVLDFFQAQARVRELATMPVVTEKAATVADAVSQYMEWFKLNRKSYRATFITIRAHVLPAFGDRELDSLTAAEIESWKNALAQTPRRRRVSPGADPAYLAPPDTAEERRARKVTANRTLTTFKAVLNFAFRAGLAADDRAWRRVQPFSKVEEPRTRFLSAAEAGRLMNAASPGLRELIGGAVHTGARFGELARMMVRDVDLDRGFVFIQPGKSGRGRTIPLSREGRAFMERVTAGRLGDDPVFIQASGRPWGKNDYSRLLAEACAEAKIEPVVKIHELRHSYGSWLAESGVDLLTISKLLGHADTRVTGRFYAHLTDDSLRKAVDLLPGIETTDEGNIVNFGSRSK